MAHSRVSVPLARKLRLTPTDAAGGRSPPLCVTHGRRCKRSAGRLWSRLRRKQLEGFRFRRQHPLGPYVVDFFCPEAKLVVEVDGGQHADDGETRTRWIEAQGYRLIRFWNNDVLANTEGVL